MLSNQCIGQTLRLAGALLLGSVGASAQTVRDVGPNGYATIQAAVDAAAPGDTIVCAAGVYPTFAVGKSLTITTQPSALVQVLTTAAITIDLQPMDRVHLGGLDIEADAVRQTGGIVSMERCTLRTRLGMRVQTGMAALRWCASGASAGSGMEMIDGHLHASECTFSTAAAGSLTIEHGGVAVRGQGTCQLSVCTLLGAWPADPTRPWPTTGLLQPTTPANTARIWANDCVFVGGFHPTGVLGPAMAVPTTTASQVRLHRCAITGLAIGNFINAPVIGIQTPVDMTIGGTFTTTMRGDPGQPLLFYGGATIFGPIPIPEVEQPALGFFDAGILGIALGDAQGRADFPFQVPNLPTLRHAAIWWRGVDIGVAPWRATPAFVTLVQ